jgi:hypothetical protein
MDAVATNAQKEFSPRQQLFEIGACNRSRYTHDLACHDRHGAGGRKTCGHQDLRLRSKSVILLRRRPALCRCRARRRAVLGQEQELAVDAQVLQVRAIMRRGLSMPVLCLRPIRRSAREQRSHWQASRAPPGGTQAFLVRCGPRLPQAGPGPAKRTGSASPLAAVCVRRSRCSASAMMGRSGVS